MASRRLWRLAGFAVLGGLLAAPTCVPEAHAIGMSRQVTVSVGWRGAECITMTVPNAADSRLSLLTANACDPANPTATTTYLSHPGEFYGVQIQAPTTVSVVCSLQVGGQIDTIENARGTVDCLRRW